MKRACLTVALLMLAAYGGGDDDSDVQTAAVTEQLRPWAEFAATTIDEYYRQNPEQAVDASLHEYDGRAPGRAPTVGSG